MHIQFIDFNKTLGLIDDEYAKSEEYLNSYIDYCSEFDPQTVHETLTLHPQSLLILENQVTVLEVNLIKHLD